MDKGIEIDSFKLVISTIGCFFLLVGLTELIGDIIALIFLDTKKLQTLQGLGSQVVLFVFSVFSAFLAILYLSKIFTQDKSIRITIIIGTITALIFLLIIIATETMYLFFGSTSFNFKENYLDIIRNMTIGIIPLYVVIKVDLKPSSKKYRPTKTDE